MKIAFFNTNEEQENYFKNSLLTHELFFFNNPLDKDHLPSQADFEVICAFVKSTISKEVIDHFPNLKLISLRSTGFDNVDLSYTKEKNIPVCNVPSYGPHTVAEFTFGLILSLTRKVAQGADRVRKEKTFDHQGLRGVDLFSKTLGVIGTGKIGSNSIRIAKGFGMKVLAFDLYPSDSLSKEYDFSYQSLEEVLKNSDILTLHTPLTPQSTHLINKDNIGLIKRGALLINTSRGAVVETEALYQALINGQLSGAGLDVLENENNLTQSEKTLIDLPQVTVTPHMAYYSIEAEQSILQITVENIQKFIEGTPQNLVT